MWVILSVVGLVVVAWIVWELLDSGHAVVRGVVETERDAPRGGEPARAGAMRGMVVRSRQADGRSVGELRLEAHGLVIGTPGRELRVPLADVVAVRRAATLFGRTADGPLLEIEWRAGGALDAVAGQVDDLDGWIEALGGEREPAAEPEAAGA